MTAFVAPHPRPVACHTPRRPARRRWVLALAGALALTACGDDASPGHDDVHTTDTEADVATGPTVTASPSDGERGVLVSRPIVLSFSEPMNTASVEAAWTSPSLPADQLAFSWNAGATILTVDASAVLAYPAGDDTVDPFDYDFTVETTATSAEGAPLAQPLTVGFQTARDVTLQLPRVVETTGGFDTNGVTTDIRVGDTASNGTWRGFVSVDLSTVPKVVSLTSASLFARQTHVVGAPYTDLGALQLVHLAPLTAIDQAAFTAAPANELGTFSDSTVTGSPGGDRAADVIEGVAADLAAGHASSSYRLQFETAQDLGNDEDHVIFDPTSVRLDLRLLAE